MVKLQFPGDLMVELQFPGDHIKTPSTAVNITAIYSEITHSSFVQWTRQSTEITAVMTRDLGVTMVYGTTHY